MHGPRKSNFDDRLALPVPSVDRLKYCRGHCRVIFQTSVKSLGVSHWVDSMFYLSEMKCTLT